MMQPADVRTSTTKHAVDCRRVFGRLDASCPRCNELATGAAPRPGWTDRRRQLDAQHREDIRRHDCTKAGCGPICTFGDW